MHKKIQIGIAVAGLVLGFGGGMGYYYTTTPNYALDKAKSACHKNDMRAFAKNSYIYQNGETTALSEEAIGKLVESSPECPYKDLFKRKTTQSRPPDETIQALGVQNARKISFEGTGETLRLVKMNGQWRFLLIGAKDLK